MWLQAHACSDCLSGQTPFQSPSEPFALRPALLRPGCIRADTRAIRALHARRQAVETPPPAPLLRAPHHAEAEPAAAANHGAPTPRHTCKVLLALLAPACQRRTRRRVSHECGSHPAPPPRACSCWFVLVDLLPGFFVVVRCSFLRRVQENQADGVPVLRWQLLQVRGAPASGPWRPHSAVATSQYN